jgi:hypothetical protein
MICLLLGKELCQTRPKMRCFYFLTTEIHESLWVKMRKELRQTTLISAQEALNNAVANIDIMLQLVAQAEDLFSR